jgi:polysaccharide export outer membrane protein
MLIALTLSSPGRAGAAGADQPYTLAPGDRISVTVVGQPDMSADMLVDGGGNITLPFVGSVSVRNMTVSDCETVLRDRLAKGFLRDPLVSVRLTEPRPIYVLGDVRAPGSYPFRYGSTVKSAVALAGGFGLTELHQSTPMFEFLLADERLEQMVFQRRSLLVRQARLEAQRDGKETFEVPPQLKPEDGSNVLSLVVTERAMMDAQATSMKAQRGLLTAQSARIRNEIDATQAQITAEKSRLDMVTQEAERSSALLKQGLGLHQTDFNMKLAEAAQVENIWRLTAQASRLSIDLGDLDLKIQDIETSFRRQLFSDLRDVREHLAELSVTLPSVREMREARLREAGTLVGMDMPRAITITRSRAGDAAVIDATETTSLEPGDVVDVRKMSPDRAFQMRTSER